MSAQMSRQPDDDRDLTRRDDCNGARWREGEPRGHYESWFMRANHPGAARAFWIRYTIFVPAGRPAAALGELWAIWFDGEAGQVTAVKQEHPIAACTFAKDGLEATIGDARMDGASLRGSARSADHHLEWSLRYDSPRPPLLLLDRPLYRGSFPKAKALVASPHAAFHGTLTVDGQEHAIDGWVGSQNHNWGSKHTDRYAWGQVAGFDGAPDVFLEVATAQVRLGPLMTPPMTPLVLRLGDEELRFSSIPRALRARGRYTFFQWSFESWGDGAHVTGTIAARARDFVALPYLDPPGGTRTCLNTKIARCDLTVRRPGRALLALHTADRAAFEILTDRTDHGLTRLVV
jgi:hypothetical protein